MSTSIHPAVVVGTFLLIGALVALLVSGAYTAERRAGRTAHQARQTTMVIALGLIAWLTLTAVAAALGMYTDFYELPPKLPLTLLIVSIVFIACLRTQTYARIVRVAPLSWPIAFQSMRVVVEIGLWRLYRDGLVPEQMTFEGYNFDIVVGLTAPLMAVLASKGWVAPRMLVAWNVAAIGFLSTIVFIAITSALGPQHLPWPGVPNAALGLFPTAWLPAFIVPLAIAGHVLSLQQLTSLKRPPHRLPTQR